MPMRTATDPVPSRGGADRQRIAAFNGTAVPFAEDVTVCELIEAQVRASPSATAVICDHDASAGGPRMTYAELDARANQLAHVLREGGVRPGQIVGLMVERSFAMVVAVLGILKAGGAYLPISPDNPPERIAYLLADGGVNILLIHGKTAGRVAFRGRTIDLDDPTNFHGPTVPPQRRHTPRDLAYVIYTSGSTGKPKGVMIEHRSLVNRLAWMQHAYPIGPADVILQKTPFAFDVSVWELLWWALHGAAVCLLQPGGERNPMAIIQAVATHRVSVMHFVPSMANAFLEYLAAKPAAAERLASVRRVFASGEALTPTHVRRFTDAWGRVTGARLTNLYGPTEATIDVTYFDCPADGEIDAVPIGRPIHNTRLYVIRDGREVPIGESGELCIAGVGLARGYLNNPELTEEKFTRHPGNPEERIYRTGDVARWRSDGNVEYLGREDHQVKIRGLRIELGEIENTAREFPGVHDCVAQVKRHSDAVILIVAHIVGDDDLELPALTQYLKRHLPDYMIPHRFTRIAELPLTPTGKVDRKALADPMPAAGGAP